MSAETAYPSLSYADYFDHPLKRRLVRAVERLSGQPRIQRLYREYRESLRHEPFFGAAVKLLDLRVEIDVARHASIPKTGPLVVVANHPFGVLDGLVICHLLSLVRTDFKVLTNAVLDGAPEASDWILPIDFAGTKEAQATNISTRKTSLEKLKNGGCIVVFPAGGVSTAPTLLSRAAVDDTWKPFTAKLITQSGANVVPIYFEGQNSRLFQLASHLSLELRLALIFREVNRRRGKRLPVHIGQVLTPEDLANAGKRAELMTFLREATYSMAPPRLRGRIQRAEQRWQEKTPKLFR
ncbi:MAG: lysophospholipid acyltransferase family protein [Hyphomonadaceae bacterium]|nr:lysophospholipid acyltransferase family protein [Hyphomonadaceae bacterium]